jgi:hypothetical protein
MFLNKRKEKIKMSDKHLLPDYPEEIRAARIGMCYDPISRRLLTTKIVIDPERLKSNSIHMIHGKGELKLRVNSTADQNLRDTFFAVDAKMKIGSWATLGYHSETAASSANASSTLNCYCAYVYTGQSLYLLDNGPEQLFNCMTEEFQKDFNALFEYTDPLDYLSRYFSFIQKYGYGCVTKLHLTSGSAFEMSAKYKEDQKAQKQKYSGSVSVNTPWAGSSAAASYAEQVSSVDANASVELVSENIPENTPTKDWCNSIMSKVLDMGLAKLAKTPSAITAYSGDSPKAPELPDGKPSEKKMPKKEAPEITKEVQEQLMKDDGFEGSWNEYKKAQKEAYEKLQPAAVIEEIQQIKAAPAADQPASAAPPAEEIMQARSAGNASLGGWDLGGYTPYAYELKPWRELFPQLKTISLPTTFSSIYIAKTFMFYLTRLQFASYLYFLADVGHQLCENPLIEQDAAGYYNACQKFSAAISAELSKNKQFAEEDYYRLVKLFDSKYVKEIAYFNSAKIYELFYENYQYFIENGVGFIQLYKDESDNKLKYYGYDGISKPAPTPFNVLAMLGDGQRLYPVLKADGSIKFVGCSGDGRWDMFRIAAGDITTAKRTDESGIGYYKAQHLNPSWLPDTGDMHKDRRIYGFNINELAKIQSISIQGKPFIQVFDFAEIRRFAEPDSEE